MCVCVQVHTNENSILKGTLNYQAGIWPLKCFLSHCPPLSESMSLSTHWISVWWGPSAWFLICQSMQDTKTASGWEKKDWLRCFRGWYYRKAVETIKQHNLTISAVALYICYLPHCTLNESEAFYKPLLTVVIQIPFGVIYRGFEIRASFPLAVSTFSLFFPHFLSRQQEYYLPPTQAHLSSHCKCGRLPHTAVFFSSA